MSHAWVQTIDINQNLARELIASQFNLKVNIIESLGEGFDNIAYLVNKELVFRFPRRKEGIECMENELALLPLIALKVSFPFSNPQFIGKPSPSYPHIFAGYKLLIGKHLYEVSTPFIKEKNFAIILGNWLKELHSIEIDNKHASLIKGDQSWRLNVEQRLSFCQQKIKQYESYFIQSNIEISDLEKAISNFSDLKFSNKRCYLHGDLYSRHLLVDNNLNPSGLIDWGDTHIGHPGLDLSVLINSLSDDNVKEFINSYGQIDEEVMAVAVFRAFCHSLSLLPYCYETKNEKLKTWTTATILRAISIATN